MFKQLKIDQIMKAHCGTRHVRIDNAFASGQGVYLHANVLVCIYTHRQFTKDMIKFCIFLIYTHASGLSTRAFLGTNMTNIKL